MNNLKDKYVPKASRPVSMSQGEISHNAITESLEPPTGAELQAEAAETLSAVESARLAANATLPSSVTVEMVLEHRGAGVLNEPQMCSVLAYQRAVERAARAEKAFADWMGRHRDELGPESPAEASE
jgi:hypothetical protein